MSKPPTQSDTGVSNGDVDWIFRGKIKKHGKGAANEGFDQKLKSPKAPVIPSPGEAMRVVQENSNGPDGSNEQQLEALQRQNQTQSMPQVQQNHQQQLQSQQATAPVISEHQSVTGNTSQPEDGATAAEQEYLTHTLALNKTSSRNRSRSSSLSSTLTRRSVDLADHQLKRRSSVSSDNKSLSTIPSNEQDKSSKKSLFSSLSSKFSKKKNISGPINGGPQLAGSNTAGVSTPASVAHHDAINAVGSYSNPVAAATASSAAVASAPPPPQPAAAAALISQEPKKRFGSLRGKVTARIGSTGLVNNGRTVHPPAPTERVILNKNPNKVKIPIEELGNLNMKRVIFDINDLKFDPPQQIPSRKPRKGNVLIPEDIIGEVPRVSVGIANSDKKVMEADSKKDINQKEYLLAIDSQKRALEEAKKHAHEAHLAALRIANEVANYKHSKNGHLIPNSNPEEEEAISSAGDHQFHAGGVDIDKPMHHHEHHFADDKPENLEFNDGDNSNSNGVDDVPLDLLYTRCCHLREILPIPATLKQLKGKSKPLHVLKFLNPKPTLIDILSFSDFIAIAPINTVIFDNVILTNEMIKVVLTSLANNKFLEKLSLKNLTMDNEAWKFLCKFLLRNHNLLRLDLSQTKYRSDLKPDFYRFNMNWNLFVDVLKKRGGLSELILTGIDFKFEDFQILIEQGMSINTKRLGLASSNISLQKCEVISTWINKDNSSCEGIDLGFNDLSNHQLSKLKIVNPDSKLLFLSLNSTNLSDIKEVSACLKNLSELPNLSYLDLSSLPNIFPQVIPYLKRYLPKFPNLKRIHLDYNHLPAKSLAAVLDVLQMCKKLIHVSLVGNDVQGVAASLYGCVKASRSIFNLDIDYDSLPELINSKIAVVLMRNMEINLHGEAAVPEGGDELEDELIFDGSLIAESAEAFLKTKTSDYEDYSNRLLKKSLINKTKVIRNEIHNTIDALFEKRNNGGLTIEGKERLLRFCLLDSALEKIVHIFEGTDELPAKPSLSRTSSVVTAVTEDKPAEHATEHITTDTPQFEEEYMHNLSKDLINTNETISPELNQIQSSEIQYLNPQQAQLPWISQAELPHQLAIEKSSDGKEVSVDTTTGRPVLFRNISQTSINAKRQEEEEGELHKWGFFVQQQKQLYPDESVAVTQQPMPKPSTIMPNANVNANANVNVNVSTLPQIVKTPTVVTKVPSSTSTKTPSLATHSTSSTSSLGSSVVTPATPKLLSLISGEQLRKAVMKAKGINSINELIDKVEHNSLNLDNIYKVPAEYQENVPLASDQPPSENIAKSTNAAVLPNEPAKGSSVTALELPVATEQDPYDDAESFKSIDSMSNKVNDLTFEDDDEEKAVDETYDKLLNDMVRVRSNK